MKISILGIMLFGLTLALGDLQFGGATNGLLQGFSIVKQAYARVGRPLTPISYAGVARGTSSAHDLCNKFVC